ncbi:MAG: hypothetical protein FJX18_02895, partial [Alphaproteobacteria bacterium]|nr:hypothetical protein [Alphaproteobacteria bacterium]
MKIFILVALNFFSVIAFDGQAALVADESVGDDHSDPAKLVPRLSVASVVSTSSSESERELTVEQKVLAVLDGN